MDEPPRTRLEGWWTDWEMPRHGPQDAIDLAADLGCSRALAATLLNRGFADTASMRAFLSPRLRDLADPEELRDMAPAAERVARAIRKGEPICVYGDHDVDGMVGTTILSGFIRHARGEVFTYVPDRLKEGYSFTDEGVAALLKREPRPGLVVTVDHGSSAAERIAELAGQGIDVVVTDHHEAPPDLPERAVAVVNPKRPDCPSTYKELCGAAVAFKLVWATAKRLSPEYAREERVSSEFREFLLEATAMVALATVADVVPLDGENRILCHYGLKALEETRRPGLRALIRKSRLKGRALKAQHCGFRLAPRLNAAGRMGMAHTAIELLATDEPERATVLANALEHANDERRALERALLDEVLASEEVQAFPGDRALVLAGEGWHLGVIGIVASRLVDRFRVPAVVIGFDGDEGRGSARSPAGVHLRDLLATQGAHLLKYGGHAQAAGCSLRREDYAAFKRGLEEESARALAGKRLRPVSQPDVELPFSALGLALHEEFSRLAPHGRANPAPLFCCRDVQVVSPPKGLGQGRKHLSFIARQGDRSFRALWWNAGELRERLAPGDRLDLLLRLRPDDYGGESTLEIEIADARPADDLAP